MSNSKTFLTFLFLCVAAMCCSPELGAQESLKSQVVTEYDGKPYYIHTVDKKQSLKDIADMYDVTIYEILKENKDVKYNVKAGELLRIPYRPKEEVAIDAIMANDSTKYVEEYLLSTFDSERLYKVALMMPLYLEQVDDAFMEAEVSNKQLLAKPFSYLHFYEGFMIAVD